MFSKKLISVALVLVVLLMVSAFSFDINNGDSVSIFDDLLVPQGTTVTGDAVVIFGSAEVRGAVRGDMVAVFGSADIYGEVGGDIVTVFGNVDVKNNAIVGGDTVGVFGNVQKDNGAIIRGDVVDTKIGSISNGIAIMPGLSSDISSVVGMMIIYALSCLVLLLVPDRVNFMAQSFQYNIGRSFGIGLLVFLGIMLLIPALVITIIGIIPAVFIMIVLFPITILVAFTALFVALGRKVAAAVEGRNALYIHLLIGLVIVGALNMVPFIGSLVGIAAFFTALGVAFDTRLGKPFVKKTQV